MWCVHVWQDEHETKRRLAGTDAREIQKFYEHYCKKYLEDDHEKRKP
jgi:callose synthase